MPELTDFPRSRHPTPGLVPRQAAPGHSDQAAGVRWAASRSCRSGWPPVRALPTETVHAGAGDRLRGRPRCCPHGVSAFPPEVTAQMVANIDAGGAAINVLAREAGASVRVVDIGVDCETPLTEAIGAHKVRRSSGNIATEDALSADEVIAAVGAGRALADEEVDAGADLLIAGDMGIGNTTAATTLIAALIDTEPVAIVGRGTGIDDDGWSRKTAAIRDALYRARVGSNPSRSGCSGPGGADLAAMVGFCARRGASHPATSGRRGGHRRRAGRGHVGAGARAWWRAGHRSTEPAHAGARPAGSRSDRRLGPATRRGYRRSGGLAGAARRGGSPGLDGHFRGRWSVRPQRFIVTRRFSAAFAFGTVLPIARP